MRAGPTVHAITRKSEMTRAAIIDAALSIVAERGLGAVSMKAVADRLQISKSGVFARSGSAETLQGAVIGEYGRRFVADVFLPAMQKPRGLPRLDAMMTRWFERLASAPGIGAAIYEAAAFSLEPVDRTLRGLLVQGVAAWRLTLRRTILQAIEEGQLRPGIDVGLFVYEMHSLVLGGLYESAFLGDRKALAKCLKAYERLVASYRP